MSIFITVLLTILLFGAIIFIHEFGHFITAKLSGVKVHEFALGMGPTLLKRQKGETKYALRALPIGGFVSMEGEESGSSDDRAFCNKPVHKRLVILAAGAAMNLLLGFVLLIVMVSLEPKLGSMEIAAFRDNAQSAQTGLQVGDNILKVDGLRIWDVDDLQYALFRDDKISQQNATFVLTVRRNGEKVTLPSVRLSMVDVTNEAGQTVRTLDFVRRQIDKNPLTVIKQAACKSVSLARLVWISLGDLVRGKAKVSELSGPVGVATVVNRVVDSGGGGGGSGSGVHIDFDLLLYLAALLTINVGIFNLLPLPALDGGRLVFVAIEGIFRRPVPAKYEAAIHAAGLVFFMLLMLFVTFNDVFRLFK